MRCTRDTLLTRGHTFSNGIRGDGVLVALSFNIGGMRFYFFSTDHCQNVDKNLSVSTVPTTFYLPMKVKPRPGLEDGIVTSIREWQAVFGRDECRVANPDAAFSVEDESHLPVLQSLLDQYYSHLAEV